MVCAWSTRSGTNHRPYCRSSNRQADDVVHNPISPDHCDELSRGYFFGFMNSL